MNGKIKNILILIIIILAASLLISCNGEKDNGEDVVSYEITFSGGEGATGTAPSIAAQVENAVFDLPSNEFTKNGFTFKGWNDGTTSYSAGVSYNMPAKAVTFTAEWEEIPKYTVTFKGGKDASGTAPTIAAQVENAVFDLPSNEFKKEGFYFTGWSDDAATYSAGTSYAMPANEVTFTAVWKELLAITFESGAETTGEAPSMDSQIEGASIILPKNTFVYEDIAFIGWTDGTNIYPARASYTMPSKAVTFTAVWATPYSVTFTGGEGATGKAPTMEAQIVGASIILPNNTFTKDEISFAGWNDGETTYLAGTKYTMPAKDVEFTAVWWSNTTFIRIDENSEVNESGDYLLFGTYPQTKVTDSAIISILGSYESNSWTSYSYYIDGSSSDYMVYTDKTLNGEKYRGVYFTSYRPFWCTDGDSTNNTNQDDNGYYISTLYWFKYEPIKWRILHENDGEALIFAELALDSQQYDYDGSSNNNYANSTIRAWLNDTFYKTAFNALQKQLIQKTNVDNSVESTGYSSNQFACTNTEDNVFLFSYSEVTNDSYGFNGNYSAYDKVRQKKSSDYAKSQGCRQSSDSTYKGNCRWWLRSPRLGDNGNARSVYVDGDVYSNGEINNTGFGIIPALVIKLS